MQKKQKNFFVLTSSTNCDVIEYFLIFSAGDDGIDSDPKVVEFLLNSGSLAIDLLTVNRRSIIKKYWPVNIKLIKRIVN